jgi:uncharacterized protein DUF6265
MRVPLLLAACAIASLPALAQAPRLDQLSWMAGCWRMEASGPAAGLGAGRVVDEMWMAPAGGAMLGVSRTVANGRASAHEFMQIREQDGGLAFIARPSGQAEATFVLARSGAREAVFENPRHDFPQRVIYRLQGDMLVGRIEGTSKGKEQSADFPMKRVACP